MGRTRENRITESAAELRRLAKRYAGRAQESRLLFLIWVKENPGCTIRQAAERAGITERHGRYLWEDYCNGGVERVIARRIGRRKKEEPAPEGTVAGMTAADMIRFINAVGELRSIDDPYKWARRLGDILMECIPEVDYAVVHVRHNMAVPQKSKDIEINYHGLPDGRFVPTITTVKLSELNNRLDLLIEQGRLQNFPYERYYFPPIGLGIYTDAFTKERSDVYLGTVLFFRDVDNPCFSLPFLSLLKEIKPLLVLVFTEFILRLNRTKLGANIFAVAIDQVASKAGLSEREQEIVFLLLAGHTHDEIAELLKVTPATVNKHTRSVYKKAGVRRLSEFFARYFTPRDYFPERGEKKGKEA